MREVGDHSFRIDALTTKLRKIESERKQLEESLLHDEMLIRRLLENVEGENIVLPSSNESG